VQFCTSSFFLVILHPILLPPFLFWTPSLCSIALLPPIFLLIVRFCTPLLFFERFCTPFFAHFPLFQWWFWTKHNCPFFLSCVSSCRALRSLKLKVYSDDCGNYGKILFPKSLNFPALTNLDLYNFTFCANDNVDCAEPFIAFTNLKSLTIVWCTVRDAPILSISSETLVNLTMFNNSSDFTKIQLSTPNLSAFSFFGTPYQKLCGTGLSSVKQVEIHVYRYFHFHFDGLPLILLNWLRNLDNVESLTVAASTLKVP